MEWLGTLNIPELGATGLLTLAIVMLFTDRLVTRGRLLDERARGDLWQQNAQTQQEINRKNAETLSNMMEAALIQKKVMEALQEHHGIRVDQQQITRRDDGAGYQ